MLACCHAGAWGQNETPVKWHRYLLDSNSSLYNLHFRNPVYDYGITFRATHSTNKWWHTNRLNLFFGFVHHDEARDCPNTTSSGRHANFTHQIDSSFLLSVVCKDGLLFFLRHYLSTIKDNSPISHQQTRNKEQRNGKSARNLVISCREKTETRNLDVIDTSRPCCRSRMYFLDCTYLSRRRKAAYCFIT